MDSDEVDINPERRVYALACLITAVLHPENETCLLFVSPAQVATCRRIIETRRDEYFAEFPGGGLDFAMDRAQAEWVGMTMAAVFNELDEEQRAKEESKSSFKQVHLDA